LFLEIGTRLGGSTKIIIDEILKKHSGVDLITIDPYGDIPYETKDGIWCKYDYDNSIGSKRIRIFSTTPLKKI